MPVFAHSTHAQLQAVFLLDELHHGCTTPQKEIHLQLLGALVADGLLNVGFLLWGEQAGIAFCPSTASGFDGGLATLLEQVQRMAH